jgi:hypothetical protein
LRSSAPGGPAASRPRTLGQPPRRTSPSLAASVGVPGRQSPGPSALCGDAIFALGPEHRPWSTAVAAGGTGSTIAARARQDHRPIGQTRTTPTDRAYGSRRRYRVHAKGALGWPAWASYEAMRFVLVPRIGRLSGSLRWRSRRWRLSYGAGASSSRSRPSPSACVTSLTGPRSPSPRSTSARHRASTSSSAGESLTAAAGSPRRLRTRRCHLPSDSRIASNWSTVSVARSRYW